jgi:hypothetical protein
MNDTETISMDEITALLKAAAARDQRTVDPIDTLAWYQDLNMARVHYRDASAALSHYYVNVWPRQDAKQRFRATAPTLIEIVREIRKKRLADTDFVYEPKHFDESGEQFVRRLNAQLSAIADGREPQQPAGQALRPRPVKELIAGVAAARALPPEIADVLAKRRNPARTVVCPYCKALKGAPCRNGAGRELPSAALHPSRTDLWASAVTPCPACRASAGEPCRELGKPHMQGAHHARVETAYDIPERS